MENMLQSQRTASSNPCPCGYWGNHGRECRCGTQQRQRCRGRVSGPILDRIDLHIEVPAVRCEDLRSHEPAEPSAAIRERVVAARNRQLDRFSGNVIDANTLMKPRHIKRYCHLDDAGEQLLAGAVRQLGLGARAYHRILKVARTIADLDRQEHIAPHHLLEAIQYRSLDRSTPLMGAAHRTLTNDSQVEDVGDMIKVSVVVEQMGLVFDTYSRDHASH